DDTATKENLPEALNPRDKPLPASSTQQPPSDEPQRTETVNQARPKSVRWETDVSDPVQTATVTAVVPAPAPAIETDNSSTAPPVLPVARSKTRITAVSVSSGGLPGNLVA